MTLIIAEDIIETAQIGVTEPFPQDHTAEAIQGWMHRNQSEIHWLSQSVLEDLITEAAPRH